MKLPSQSRIRVSRAAMREVQAKSEAEIEAETAARWAMRAVACYKLYAETDDSEWLIRAEDYKHEALEHGAQVGDQGKTVKRIEAQLNAARRGFRKGRR